MDLLFYKAVKGDYVDRLVGFLTGGLYSHVELRFSDGNCFSSSYRDGGTRFKLINVDPQKWVAFHVFDINEIAVREWCQQHDRLPYDMRGAIRLLFQINIAESDKYWYCSEICSVALLVGSLKLKPRMYRQITPSAMYMRAIYDERFKLMWLY